MTVIRHINVCGRVQGVGFRAFVEREALKRGLGGWVRNRGDDMVEAVFEGEQMKVGAAIEICRRGPIGARVDAVYEDEGTEDDLKLRQPGELFSVLADA